MATGAPPSSPARSDPARVVTVWCPNWPVVAAGAAPIDPVAVVHRYRVVAVSRAAAAQGVAVGLRQREAQARCSALVVHAADPLRDALRFEPVVQAVGGLVPLVEVTEPGGLCFAARGPARFLGGEEAVGRRVLEVVRAALGPSGELVDGVGVGIADTRFAAGVAARRSVRTGRPVVVPPGHTRAFLDPVAVRALAEVGGVPLDLVERWRRLGLSRLGQLAALDPADLLARFGTDGVTAHGAAAGLPDAPVVAAPPPEDTAVQQVFDDPVSTVAPLVFVAKQLADQLAGHLGRRGQICTRLVVEAETEHGESTRRVWYRPTGLGSAAMVERVRWQLDGWAAGGLTGGVTLLRLNPLDVRAHDGHQPGLWGGRSEADEWAARVVARVSGLLGPDAVTVPVWRGGRGVEEQFTLVPATLTDPDDRGEQVRPGPEPWPGRLPAPSPVEVWPSALAAVVLDDAGAVVRVSGRGEVSAPPAAVAVAGGEAVPVVAWAGPWPAETGWWDPARHRRRARFQLLTATGAAYAATLEGGRWWIEGRFS